MMHTTSYVSQSFGFWVRQPSRNVHSFEVFERRHRIKKPQIQNCNTYVAEKKVQEYVTAELKFARLTAHIVVTK